MADRLLHQRAQPRLHAVVGPLGVAEPVDGAAVADRRVPVLPRLGHAAEPSIQQAGDLDRIQRVVQPCQGEQLLLVAAPGPAAVHPQQVTPDRAHRPALGGVGVPLGVIQHLLVAPPSGSLHPGAEPIHQHRLPGCGHLGEPLAQLLHGRDEAAVGWQNPSAASSPSSRSMLPPHFGLGDAHHAAGRGGTTARPAAPRPRRPGGPPTPAAGCHPSPVGAAGPGGPSGRPAR